MNAIWLKPELETATLSLDSTVGGLGDIWMRLSALYSLAALVPFKSIQLRIPKSLLEVAQLTWPDRFLITSDFVPEAIEITHLGLRHLLPRLMAGERFLTPFYQILRADRKASNLKHRLNHVLTQAAKGTGSFLVPKVASVNCYQGYHELSAVSELSAVPYQSFVQQAREDFARVRERLLAQWPKHERPRWRVIVLPSGTGHQIMPPNWARANLPEATYAFFLRDEYKTEFLNRGLRVVEFDSLESLLTISSQAEMAVVTDSFPSHPLQAYSSSTIVALSQQPQARIVHPAFDGGVVHSKARCCPCANRARSNGACDAGLEVCTTWSDKQYTRELLAGLL